jgi:hypothetical protein
MEVNHWPFQRRRDCWFWVGIRQQGGNVHRDDNGPIHQNRLSGLGVATAYS